MTTKLKQAADALGQARADLDALRDKIEDLQAERQRVANAPCDRAEAERRITSLIQREAATGVLKPLAQRLTGSSERGAALVHTNHALAADPFAVLASVVPDALRAAILNQVPDGGLSEVERVSLLAALDRDLEAACIAEELCAREIERATGAALPRRQDADARILLAPDRELEGEADHAD